MSEFWSLWVVLCVLGSLFACLGLIAWASRRASDDLVEDNSLQASLKSWGDVRAYDAPVPPEWLYLFYLGIFFAAVYFSLYPALGKFPGALLWTSERQYSQAVGQYQIRYAAKYSQYLTRTLPELAKDPVARKTGQRLFMTYCSNCHQTAGQDREHYPKLTDRDWLWGGNPDQIEATITNGRTGIMPAWGAVLGEQGVAETASYVISLAGYVPTDPGKIAAGKEKFALYCAFCHAADGRGDQRQGSPNLADKTWTHIASRDVLYNPRLEAGVRAAIANGFTNLMPSHWNMLDRAQIHLLAAYVYSLSN